MKDITKLIPFFYFFHACPIISGIRNAEIYRRKPKLVVSAVIQFFYPQLLVLFLYKKSPTDINPSGPLHLSFDDLTNKIR